MTFTSLVIFFIRKNLVNPRYVMFKFSYSIENISNALTWANVHRSHKRNLAVSIPYSIHLLRDGQHAGRTHIHVKI